MAKIRYHEDASYLRKWVLSTLDSEISRSAKEEANQNHKNTVSKDDMTFAVSDALDHVSIQIRTLIGPVMRRLSEKKQIKVKP